MENKGNWRTAVLSSIQERGCHSAFECSSNFIQESHWQGTAKWFNLWLDLSHSGSLSASVGYLCGWKERKSKQCRITATISQDRQRECKIKFLMWKEWDNEPLSPRYLRRGSISVLSFLLACTIFHWCVPKKAWKPFIISYFLFLFTMWYKFFFLILFSCQC